MIDLAIDAFQFAHYSFLGFCKKGSCNCDTRFLFNEGRACVINYVYLLFYKKWVAKPKRTTLFRNVGEECKNVSLES